MKGNRLPRVKSLSLIAKLLYRLSLLFSVTVVYMRLLFFLVFCNLSTVVALTLFSPTYTIQARDNMRL